MTKLILDGVKLGALYTFLNESLGTLTEYNDKIKKKIVELGEYWQGQGYNALYELYTELEKSLADLVSEMTSFSDNVDTIDKNGQIMYDAIKSALALAGIVDVVFEDYADGNSGDYETVYGLQVKYDDPSKAMKDAETTYLNLQADVEVLKTEYNDTLINIAALESAYKSGKMDKTSYDKLKSELDSHKERVQTQLKKYEAAEAKMAELTANNDHFDLVHYIFGGGVEDGKIREGSDGFFKWGKDIDLVNEGVSEAISYLEGLEPTSVICDTAAVNGLYAWGSDYLTDSFLEGSSVSQTAMQGAFVASGDDTCSSDEGDVVYFNSKSYIEAGKTAIINGESNEVSSDNMEWADSSRVFNQESAYEAIGCDDTYVDGETGNTYDSVRVKDSDGNFVYMTYAQYQTKQQISK